MCRLGKEQGTFIKGKLNRLVDTLIIDGMFLIYSTPVPGHTFGSFSQYLFHRWVLDNLRYPIIKFSVVAMMLVIDNGL